MNMKNMITLLCSLFIAFAGFTGCENAEPEYWDFYNSDANFTGGGDDDDDDPDDPDPSEKAPSVKVMSFNVRYVNADDTGDKSWDVRKTAVVAMVAEQQPDIMGVQEPRYAQKSYMDTSLPGYKSVGVGRNDGSATDSKGEFMAIYYRSETVKIDDWGTFWLSETPGTPSKGWDANVNRSATWAVITHLESNKKFFCINTHLDHEGTTARAQSMVLIEAKMRELNSKGYPMVLTADFNTLITDAIFNGIKAFMQIARSTATSTDSRASFNNFGSSTSYGFIDHIFYSDFKALKFQTIDKRYASVPYISDHYPIMVELEFKTAE